MVRWVASAAARVARDYPVARGDVGARREVERGDVVRVRVVHVEVRFLGGHGVTHVGLHVRVERLVLGGGEAGNRDHGQKTDDDDYDETLEQSKSALVGSPDTHPVISLFTWLALARKC